MAVDPKKMEAWLRPSDEEEDETEMPEEPTDEAPEEEEEESPEEEAAEGDLEQRYPTLFQALEDNGADTESAADILDPEMLTNPDTQFEGEELDLLHQACDAIPEEVKDALKAEAQDLTFEDATEIAEALAAGEHIEDPERFAGFLFHVRQCLGG